MRVYFCPKPQILGQMHIRKLSIISSQKMLSPGELCSLEVELEYLSINSFEKSPFHLLLIEKG